jgi:Mce-associated membrane protein
VTEKARAGKPKKPAGKTIKETESRLLTESRRRKRWRLNREVKLVPVILVALILASGGAATWLYFQWYRPTQQTDAGVASTVVKAASDGTVALLSYSAESLDKDFAGAKSHLSGDFLSYYDQFTQQIVAPAAKQNSLKKTAHVMRAAVSELHPDSAVVLIFVDMMSTSRDKPAPSMDASSVLVKMTRVNDNWLISDFNAL